MSDRTSRRVFLRTAASGVVTGLLGCSWEGSQERTGEARRRESGDGGRGDTTLRGGSGVSDRSGPVVADRPVVRPFRDDAVRIATPLSLRPAAYVSMATRQVFVDRAYRDRASWLLDAHISVSTWVWRIPLPGDSRLTPIPPGDESREFDELPVGAWDPSIEPMEGDVRIVLGRRVASVIEVDCVPIQGSDHRLAAGRIELERCLAGPGEAVREDFRRLASGSRHVDPECADEGIEVDVLGWSCMG